MRLLSGGPDPDPTDEPDDGANGSSKHTSFRYPGSISFSDSDLDRRLFRGRQAEAAEVLHSILSSELLVIYAASGMGKTSLLNAGVMQALRERGYWPVSIRLNTPSLNPVPAIREQIAKADLVDDSVEVVPAPDAPERIDGSLFDLLAWLEVWKGNDLQDIVLILDQFEELFTLDWAQETRSAFIEALGSVVRGYLPAASIDEEGVSPRQSRRPRAKLVVVIREDSLGELEALSDDIPQILDNRFRLRPLSVEQARAALSEPAAVEDELLASQPFTYGPRATEEILAFLQTRRGRVPTTAVDAIDPSQLQIIGQHVEREILPGKPPPEPGALPQVNIDDVGGREGLDHILSAFYRSSVESFPEERQPEVRRLCEEGLINQNRRRLSLEEGEIEASYRVTPAVLASLVNRRLIRAEPRVGSVYYELAHDTLVDAILADRDQRRLASARKTRRRKATALLVGAAFSVILLTVALVLSLLSQTDQLPREALRVDEPLTGSIEAPDDSSAYSVDDVDVISVVRVEPALDPSVPGLNAVVEATTASGLTRQQNQFEGAQPENLVLVPSAEGGSSKDVLIRSFDGSTGGFSVSLDSVPKDRVVEPLPVGDSDVQKRIGEAGDLAVLVLENDGSPVVVTVEPDPATDTTPSSEDSTTGREVPEAPEAPEAPEESVGDTAGLDVELEVIDPSGVGRQINTNGAGKAESYLFGESPGRYFVVVRGSGSSTGGFSASAEELAGWIRDGKAISGTVGNSPTGVGYAFERPDEGTYVVRVTPETDLNAVLEITGPDGQPITQNFFASNYEEARPLPAAGGRYLIRVTGFEGSKGDFELRVDEVQPQPVSAGDAIAGSELAVFVARLGEGEFLELAPEPDSADTYVWAGAFNPQGDLYDWDFPEFGSPARVLAGRGLTGDYQVFAHAGTGGFSGSVEAVDVEPLGIGDPVEIPGAGDRSPGRAVHSFAVTDGADLEVTVKPRADFDALLKLIGPAGDQESANDGGPNEAESLSANRGDGTYYVVVGGRGKATGPYRLSLGDRSSGA